MKLFNCTQNKRRTVKSVIDRLEELDLISSAEKDTIDRPWYTTAEMKAGIYDILCKKEYTTGTQILKIVKELDGDEKSAEDTANRNELVTHFQQQQINVERKNHFPCLPVEMVHYLFGFLSVGDIKNCRLVSRDWNSVVREVLMRRTSISIGRDRSNRLLADFYSCFSVPDAQLTAFEICHPDYTSRKESERTYPWSILQLTRFFDDQQKFMKCIKLTDLYLVKNDIENKEILEDFDISPWIAESLIAKPNHQYLTKLTIDAAVGTTIIIPLHIIAHVKELYLEYCTVPLSPGVQICPVKLKFLSVTFQNNGIDLPNLIINDIVNLSNTKELSLRCESDDDEEITLDLSGSIRLQKLCLENIKTLNWATSKWTIQNMDICNVEFLLKTEMTFTEFNFDLHLKTIDLFVLPQSIERLTINTITDDTTAVCTSQQMQLNCLKYLQVEAGLWLNIFSPFVNCPQLTHLYLNGNSTEFAEIKSSLVPKSVRVLKLRRISIIWEDDDPLKLEKLILQDISYKLVRKLFIAETLVNDLVLELGWYSRSDSNFFDFSWEFQQLCFFGEKRLYVGGFKWSNHVPFQESPLYDRVDKESEYYIFENRKGIKGRAISSKEFDEKSSFP